MNSGDSTLHFNEDIDNIKMAICFYDIFNNVWKKVDLYTSRSRVSGNVQVIGSLDPEDGLLMRRGVILPASLFLQERPLYYLSSIVPTMYLILEIPGYEPLYSEKSDVIEIFLNGERINSKRTRCYSCGELYMMMHHNEVMEEYILVNYGNNISNYLLGKAFMCNFDFTRRLLPIATHP